MLSYPETKCGDDVVSYPGGTVADPYRWLEDSGAATQAWAAAQTALTESVLAKVGSREEIRSQLTARWNHTAHGVPYERGGRWFQTRASGLQNQPVLYVMDAPGAQGRVLIDPNTLSAEGTSALSAVSVSPDGSLVAYAVGESGSDWLRWHLRDVATGKDLDETLHWCKFGNAEWRKDGTGFYYSTMEVPRPGDEYTAVSRDKRIVFHRPGTPQEADDLIFVSDDPERYPDAAVTPDGHYLVVALTAGIGTGPELRVQSLRRPGDGWRVLFPECGAMATVVAASEDGTFHVLTDHSAQTRRIVAIDLDRPEPGSWREIVPAGGDPLLEAHFFGGRLVCHYLRDSCSVLRVYEMDGTFVRDIPLPDMSALGGSSISHEMIEGDPDSDVFHFQVVSFTASGSLWSHDLRTGETAAVQESGCSLDPATYVTERVGVTSADGTVVPMFLTRRRDLARTGDAPALLYAYGGVGTCITPGFSVHQAVWVERGGILAVASLRGGGERGRAWHDAGKLANKQNVFDDFCACARWLAGSGWSRPGRIAINGRSNGGLLVGACLAQHPELFGAALADVGVMDMLRFHLFTVGGRWMTEYGNPEAEADFQWLRSYSPLHNLAPARYPPTLVSTADHDDRVVPAHSYKFTAALQAAQRGDAPVLLRVDTAAGHGHGKPTAKAIAEATDKLAFLELAMGLHPRQPVG